MTKLEFGNCCLKILGDEGHAVLLAENASQARTLREQEQLDLVLLDIWMPDTDGVTLLKNGRSKGLLTMPVIMMSGHATIDTAVEATRIGALDFLEKPISLQKLLGAVEKGLARGKNGAVGACLDAGSAERPAQRQAWAARQLPLLQVAQPRQTAAPWVWPWPNCPRSTWTPSCAMPAMPSSEFILNITFALKMAV